MVAWLFMITAAALAGRFLDLESAVPLRLAAPLCLLVLAVPALRTRSGLAAGAAAAVAAVVGHAGAGEVTLVGAAVAGALAGLIPDRREGR